VVKAESNAPAALMLVVVRVKVVADRLRHETAISTKTAAGMVIEMKSWLLDRVFIFAAWLDGLEF